MRHKNLGSDFFCLGIRFSEYRLWVTKARIYSSRIVLNLDQGYTDLYALKASCPIPVTEWGIVMDVSPVQFVKALPLMNVTELGIIVFEQPAIKWFDDVSMIALQLPLESYALFPFSTLMEFSPEHPKKAQSPIDVTEKLIIL